MEISKKIPLFQGGNRADLSCYRPISLPMSLSRILEKAMYSRATTLSERFSLFCNQLGFHSRRSTIDTLAKISEKIRLAAAVQFFLTSKRPLTQSSTTLKSEFWQILDCEDKRMTGCKATRTTDYSTSK